MYKYRTFYEFSNVVRIFYNRSETIHSFFGIPLEVCTQGNLRKTEKARILTVLHADIIIDEVSMVGCDIVENIDCTLRHVMRNTQFFAGKTGSHVKPSVCSLFRPQK